MKPVDPSQQKPITYTVQEDKYQYFKPKVEVEFEEEGNKSHVKELHIRGKTYSISSHGILSNDCKNSIQEDSIFSQVL